MRSNKWFSFVALLFCLMLTSVSVRAQQTNITSPVGSVQFGASVTSLPNGNVVVTDPSWAHPNGAVKAGAVYLFNGATGALLSTLTGSTANDLVGSGGVRVLANGNFVVISPSWNAPTGQDAGAVTFGNSSFGVSGEISSANSVTGERAADQVGSGGVTILPNGNYVVISPRWNNPSGPTTEAGAVTFGNGTTGVTSVVSAANSLVGAGLNDRIGLLGVTALTNGSYVVNSDEWDNPAGSVVNVGAITWCNGSGTSVGAVTTGNSLVGSRTGDKVGSGGITVLTNGNYIFSSPIWDNPTGPIVDAGAVTWCSSSGGTTGAVTSINSLVGLRANDQVGSAPQRSGVVALNNGNYVVDSPNWDNPTGPVLDVGAVTWCNGATGTSGAVTTGNSLFGSTANDVVGRLGVAPLASGNYVVSSDQWTNPIGHVSSVGAVTWCNGAVGTVGAVTATNSLVGSTSSDQVGGNGVIALTNGNYVIASSAWDNPIGPISNVGAVTWCSGSGGTVGVVTSANSLVGSRASDRVGDIGVQALTNGNYVVSSDKWDDPIGLITDVGAVTWGNGKGGTVGPVTSSNSLVGSTASDRVGTYRVTPLGDGNYVINSPYWNNPLGPVSDAGEATWGNGTGGTVGAVTAANSLVGTTANDQVGVSVTPVGNDGYVVFIPSFNEPSVGAVSYTNGKQSLTGPVSSINSVIATSMGNGDLLNFSFDALNDQLVVGRPQDNKVTFFRKTNWCAYSIVPPIRSFQTAGGSGLFTLNTTSGCSWTTTSNVPWITITSGASGSDKGTVNYSIQPNADPAARTGTITVGGQTFTVNQLVGVGHIPFDFDGDGRTDVSVFRPSTGNWYLNSSQSGFAAYHFGISTDMPTPADFTGDGKTDIAVYRPSEGIWYVMRSEDLTVYAVGFGISTDLPVPGDYDGDGKADIAVYRASLGTWYLQRSTAGFAAIPFGIAEDKPTVGDFDGDGKTDIALYRPSTLNWYRLNSSDGSFSYAQFGAAGDIPLVMDYDGDGKANLTVFRPGNNTWYIARPTGNPAQNYDAVVWGVSGDIPVPADYDGDGKSDVAVFRPSDGNWYLLQSTSGYSSVHFGSSGDKPTPNAFGY